MALKKEAKEYLGTQIKLAREKLSRNDFDGFRDLSIRMVVASEIFPDEIWSSELKFAFLVISAVGSTTDRNFKDLKDDEKQLLVKSALTFLDNLWNNIRDDDVRSLHTSLKMLSLDFVKVFGP